MKNTTILIALVLLFIIAVAVLGIKMAQSEEGISDDTLLPRCYWLPVMVAPFVEPSAADYQPANMGAVNVMARCLQDQTRQAPTSTPVVFPTDGPIPTDEPTATATLPITSTPVTFPTDEPTSTPVPTATSEPTSTPPPPTATATPLPTPTPPPVPNTCDNCQPGTQVTICHRPGRCQVTLEIACESWPFYRDYFGDYCGECQ